MVIQNFKSGRVLRSELPFILPLRRQARCIIYLFLCNILLKKQYLKTAININPQSFMDRNLGMALLIGLGLEFSGGCGQVIGQVVVIPSLMWDLVGLFPSWLTWLASWCLLLVGPALSFFSCGLQHELLDYFTTC